MCNSSPKINRHVVSDLGSGANEEMGNKTLCHQRRHCLKMFMLIRGKTESVYLARRDLKTVFDDDNLINFAVKRSSPSF